MLNAERSGATIGSASVGRATDVAPVAGSSLNLSLRSASRDRSIATSACQSPLSTPIRCVRQFARCSQVWRKSGSLIEGRFANANFDPRCASSERFARPVLDLALRGINAASRT